MAHDWLCGLRGGERVLERICALVQREFEPAGLLTMFDDGKPLSPTVDEWRRRGLIRASAWNWLGRGSLRRWLLPIYPRAVAGLSNRLAEIHAATPIDLVISTSSAAIKGLKPPAGVKHVCYCHSPARYVWSRGDDYGRGRGLKAALRRAGLGLYSERFRVWDRATAANVDRFIANSSHTASEIRRCYGVESVVIHPPVRTDFFTPDPNVVRGDFWLVVGAVEPYKRVDLAIAAAKIAKSHLVIAGGGSQLDSMARQHGSRGDLSRILNIDESVGPRVEFLGRVDDEALRQLYRRAKVLIFPHVEDFGIVAVEAQACGLPLVARAEGGALDIVVNRKTGTFFNDASPTAIADAAASIPPGLETACRQNALRFTEERFDAAILGEIREALTKVTAGSAAPSRR